MEVKMPKKGIDALAKNLFFKTISKVKDEKHFEEFFYDLFSSSEVKDVSRRLLAAKMLIEGKTYLQIKEEMGMSEGTINKIYFKTKGSHILRRFFS